MAVNIKHREKNQLKVQEHYQDLPNEVLYDILSQGASKLSKVNVRSSKKVPVYQVNYTSLNL